MYPRDSRKDNKTQVERKECIQSSPKSFPRTDFIRLCCLLRNDSAAKETIKCELTWEKKFLSFDCNMLQIINLYYEFPRFSMISQKYFIIDSFLFRLSNGLAYCKTHFGVY